MRAAELSLASDTIFPFFTTTPTCPVLSLCTVTVRWNGLWGRWAQRQPHTAALHTHPPGTAHLSLTTMTIFSGDAFFSAL